MVRGIPEEVMEALKAKIPMGRLARPEEIGKAVGFLAADADYITGQQIAINGGVYMP
jgi:acetoacetyl-CoA reductase/3-oxoacyl-[acyl-carrier protein] reductase